MVPPVARIKTFGNAELWRVPFPVDDEYVTLRGSLDDTSRRLRVGAAEASKGRHRMPVRKERIVKKS